MPKLRFAAPKERRVALVTGGARGIGGASALRIAEEGRDVVIADIEDGSAMVKEIEALGQKAIYIKVDIADEKAVHAVVAQTVDTFGRLDILVCCAGILGKEKPFLEQTAAEFQRVLQINVAGVYYSHQAAPVRGMGRRTLCRMACRKGRCSRS